MEIQTKKSERLLAFKNRLQKEIAICAVFMDYPLKDEKHALAVSKLIIDTFPSVEPKKLLEGIKNGYTGMYGRTYKMTVQEICLWIRCHIEGKKPRDYERTNDEI